MNNNIENTDNIELVELYKNTLEDYARGVKSKWRLSPPDIDDAMNVAYLRDELDEYTIEFDRRGFRFNDFSELKSIDEEWLAWIKYCVDAGDVKDVLYPNNDEPDRKWWMHIETLSS